MKISVCMATYNGESYIEEQLESILCQLGKEDEIIVSDDSSTDNTVKIIKSYKDDRIKIFENQKFKSPIFNFENSIYKATGDIIILSDQDDVWLGNKISIIRENLINKENMLIVLDCYVVDKNLNITHESLFDYLNSKKGILKNLYINSYLGCNMAFTADIKRFILPFPKDIGMHDVWIGLISELYSNIEFINQKVMYFRRHGNNATPQKGTFLKIIKMRILLIKNIIKRRVFNK